MASGTSRVSLLAVALALLLPLAPAACIFDDGNEGGGSTRDTGPTSSTGGTFVLLVPDVMGMELAEAETRLHDAGLIPATKETYSKERQNTVLSQDPGSGSEVQGFSVVVLGVGSTSEIAVFVVPDVMGMKAKKAKARMRDAGLIPVTAGRTKGPQGVIVGQNREVGSEVAKDSVVILGVEVPIPNVVGMTKERAERVLLRASYPPSFRRVYSTVARNRVISQDRVEGWWTTVTLVISNGPPPPSFRRRQA